ncbi:MAG: class I SAM-dependent methyltransferase [Sedimentisphaerales bacterium]|nr:class I SAM-dependent methyltransferase [Sedimentisphaerales bacterium]
MSNQENRVKLPTALLEPLCRQELIVAWIAELTNTDPQTVENRLRQEFEHPGINVRQAFEAAGLRPFVWSQGLADFYGSTDAFLYELVLWNMNRRKRRIRRWVGRHLARRVGQNLKILSIGDGLGFDSAFLAQAGHDVTYFELPGYSQRFAQKVFQRCAHQVNIITDPKQIPQEAFDVVLCLDVLEHVPDVPEYVKQITSYLKPEGFLVVHAPFFMVHASTPTHLKANRRYSGSLKLYRRQGLHLIYGEPRWDPLLLQKRAKPMPWSHRLSWRMFGLRFAGLILSIGRVSMLPFCWVNRYRSGKGDWFMN